MKYFIILLSLLLMAYTGGCRRAGSWLVRNDQPQHADVMLLLMGSIADRVMQAADIYNAGLSGRLVIVEENMGPYKELEKRGFSIISNTSQAKDASVHLGIPADSIIILEGSARSTITEAECVINYLRRTPSIDTLVLVTSASHTRRASIILSTAIRKAGLPVTVRCSPSNYSQFDARHWWRDREGIQTVISEYLKISVFILFESRKSEK